MSVNRIHAEPNSSRFASDPSKNEWLTKNEGYVFSSDAEVMEAMRNPLYHTDPDFRYAVHVVIGRSPGVLNTHGIDGNQRGVLEAAMENKDGAAAAEQREIFNEQTKALFGSELYKTSATERKRVRELIAANSDLIDANGGAGRLIDRRGQGGRIEATADDFNEIKAKVAKEREDNRETAAQDAAQRAYERCLNGEVGTDSDDDE
jgi:hypothetical protein